MSTTGFVLHLGQGWYMDPTGRLHQEPVAAAATYELKGQLPFDAQAVSTVFKDLAGALPDKDDPKSLAKFAKFGLPQQTIEFLAAIGVVAGLAATTFGIAAFVFAVLKMVGVFADAPDPLMAKLDAVANELRGFSRAQGNEARDRMITEIQAPLTLALNAAKKFADQLRMYTLDEQALELRLQDMRGVEGQAFAAAHRVTNTLSWTRAFDVNEYTGSWFWIYGRLHLHPEGGAPTPLALWGQGELRLDHRIMVPVALYAVQAYLTLIKAITPEYRTTGDFRDNLRSLANNVGALASNIRAQGLAKVVYSREAFMNLSGELLASDPNHLAAFTRFTVGAVDLANYTDVFIRNPPIDGAAWLAAEYGAGTIRRGQLEFYWDPPSPAISFGGDVVSYEDPDACAAAANLLAEERYVELLAASGYLQLSHQATLLRHLSTEPNVSETVIGQVDYTRTPVGADSVTAKSPPIPFVEDVSAPATRRRQEWTARARIRTQPRGHQLMIPYRLFLRSLRLTVVGDDVADPDYGHYYRTTYEDAPADEEGFKLLKVAFASDRLLGQVELLPGFSPSPPEPIGRSGTRSLPVDSFDWYTPVDYEAARYSAFWDEAIRAAAEIKGEKPRPMGPLTLRETSLQFGQVQTAVADLEIEQVPWSDVGTLTGERRHLSRESVEFSWALHWSNDRLTVTVEGRPRDRSYVLFLVVEEKMISGQLLHTAFPLAMNNQVIEVPRSFFVEEDRAWKKSAEIIHDLNVKYAESVGPRPQLAEALRARIQPGDFLIRPGLKRVAAFYERNAPELVRDVIRTRGASKRARDLR